MTFKVHYEARGWTVGQLDQKWNPAPKFYFVMIFSAELDLISERCGTRSVNKFVILKSNIVLTRSLPEEQDVQGKGRENNLGHAGSKTLIQIGFRNQERDTPWVHQGNMRQPMTAGILHLNRVFWNDKFCDPVSDMDKVVPREITQLVWAALTQKNVVPHCPSCNTIWAAM